MIRLFTHKVHPEAIQLVQETLQSGWTGLGPKVKEFEEKVAAYLNTPVVVALNSGTAALRIAFDCLPGPALRYVITTPLTFVSTNHVILQSRLIPVFADIEIDTGNIDAQSILKLLGYEHIREKLAAIVVVHYGGQPVDMDRIYDIANDYNVDVIEDCSHAFGATYEGLRIGTKYSKYCCFSLHSVKPLAIGDGGIFTTNQPELAEIARQLRWCGIDKSTAERRTADKYSWDYDVKLVGHKFHMNDIQAAIALGQLLHVDEDRQIRQQLVDLYRQQLQDVNGITLLDQRPNRTSANHLFVILCQDMERKLELMQYLQQNGIESGCHYRPTHMYPIYEGFETDDGCPRSIEFFSRAITLPLHVNLTDADVVYVCDKIKEFSRR